MDKYSASVFSKYIDGNKSALTGLGVIATIAALFLGLNRSDYGDSLRNLQLLLLMFLILGLIFLTIDSVLWFKNNADSYFSGLITFSLGLTTFRMCEFVLANFRSELNNYLLLIYISVTLCICIYVNRIKYKTDLNIDDKYSGITIKPFLHGLVTLLAFYIPNTFIGYYSDFIANRNLSFVRLLTSFSNTYMWTMAIWVFVAEFCLAFFFTKERARLWLSITLLIILIVSAVFILWDPILSVVFSLNAIIKNIY